MSRPTSWMWKFAIATILATTAQAQTETPQAKGRLRARHILITWKSAPAAGPETKLTKEEARQKADKLLEELGKGGDFAALARKESICSSRNSGGDLGQFKPGTMLPQFEQAVRTTKIGEFAGPIETPHGFHLLQRLPIETLWPNELAASHILIAWHGAERATKDVEKRTQKDAMLLAQRLLAEIRTGKTTFEEAAKAHSNDRASGQRGGSLGTIAPSDAVPAFVDALVLLQPTGIGGPIETQFGYHIVRRDKDEKPMRASHILVPWKGAARAPAEMSRSREDAMTLAKEILRKAQGGADFAALAKEHSSCPSKLVGGDLHEFRSGQMVKAFEAAVKEATVGAIVGPVETQFGFHIVLRTK